MELRSPAFADGDAIPVTYTCDGDDVSPPLEWTAPPAGARSLALVFEDVDAGRYPLTLWLAWSFAAEAAALAENTSAPREGRNDYGADGYRGPCPPPGKQHRYVFRLLALDHEPELAERVDRRRSFDAAVNGHVVAEATLTGRYGR